MVTSVCTIMTEFNNLAPARVSCGPVSGRFGNVHGHEEVLGPAYRHLRMRAEHKLLIK